MQRQDGGAADRAFAIQPVAQQNPAAGGSGGHCQRIQGQRDGGARPQCKHRPLNGELGKVIRRRPLGQRGKRRVPVKQLPKEN